MVKLKPDWRRRATNTTVGIASAGARDGKPLFGDFRHATQRYDWCHKVNSFLVLTLPLYENPENIDLAAGLPQLQSRNVEVFDSDGAVITGTSFPLITLFAALTCGQDSGSTALSSGASFTDT